MPHAASDSTDDRRHDDLVRRPHKHIDKQVFTPGSVFEGKQHSGSGKTSYNVVLEIQNCLADGSFEGSLHIDDLTPDYPILSTFFQAELIEALPGCPFSVGWLDSKLTLEPLNDCDEELTTNTIGFVTGKWGASEDTDKLHWSLFPCPELFLFIELHSSRTKSPRLGRYNVQGSDIVFYRLKELFVLPDHKVTSVSGASFSGFYYLAYFKKERKIVGYYFHKSSELYQKMEVSMIHDGALSGQWDFR